MAVKSAALTVANPKSVLRRILKRCRTAPNGCLVWTGAKGPSGGELKYGSMNVEGRTVAVHRAMYAIVYGEIPEDKWVLHSCDYPPCCNPGHLFLGDCALNVADKIAKGRFRAGSGYRADGRPNNSILTQEKVAAIKGLLNGGDLTHTEIAQRYGVSRIAISNIANGRRWARVEAAA